MSQPLVVKVGGNDLDKPGFVPQFARAVAAQNRRATLLPSVWQQLPDPAEFLDALWRKAGLPRGYWSADLLVQRYVAQRSAARPVLTAATGAGVAAGSVRGRLAPATAAHRTRTIGPRGRR